MKYESNEHIFGEKLKNIMIEKGMIDKKGKPDKVALYNLLFPNAIITEDLRQQDPQKVVDLTRTISYWLKGNRYPKTINSILDICNALNCDLDYFFTDLKAPTHDIQFISTQLDISYKSVMEIIKYDSEIKKLLDSIICGESDLLYALLLALWQYGISVDASEITIKDIFDNEEKITQKEIIRNIFKENTVDTLEALQLVAEIVVKNLTDNIHSLKQQIVQANINDLKKQILVETQKHDTMINEDKNEIT